MKSQICFIRHGITEGNARRLYYGKTDVPLAQKGIDELKALTSAGIYPDRPESIIFTTGLVRTTQTKELIYGDRPHGVIEDLQEINFGEFEMKSYEELLSNADYRDWITAEDLDKVPPGGESIRQFNHRVIRGYETVREEHREFCYRVWPDEEERSRDQKGDYAVPLTIVICHGGTISALMNHIWPGVHDNMYGWIPDPGHGYLLTLEDDEITGHEEF